MGFLCRSCKKSFPRLGISGDAGEHDWLACFENENDRLRAALAAAQAGAKEVAWRFDSAIWQDGHGVGFAEGIKAAEVAAKNARDLSDEQKAALTTGFGSILPATDIFQLGCDTASGAIRALRPAETALDKATALLARPHGPPPPASEPARVPSEEIARFINAADKLRNRWLNDGHELRDPGVTRFREARQEYDAARVELMALLRHER